VDRVVVLGGIFACELQDYLRAARMVGEEVGDIPNVAVEDDPTRVFGGVFLD
jgi:hypothetical protein